MQLAMSSMSMSIDLTNTNDFQASSLAPGLAGLRATRPETAAHPCQIRQQMTESKGKDFKECIYVCPTNLRGKCEAQHDSMIA
jgi:hypothetical protein